MQGQQLDITPDLFFLAAAVVAAAILVALGIGAVVFVIARRKK